MPLRVAIVGAGSMGHTHARAWAATDARIAAVIAADLGSATPLAARYSARFGTELDEVLPHVDIVDICTPTPFHDTYTMRAAAAGKHIFCEKPIARTLPEGRAMIAAAEAAGVRLFIGMTTRFFPQYRAIYDAVAAGQVGKPGVIRLTRASYRPHKSPPSADWFSDFEASGGPILDMMIHDYDYARWIAGEVERVYARWSPVVDGINPYAQVVLRFRSGAVAHIEGGWVYPPPLFRIKAEVAGDGGLIEWESDSSTPVMAHLMAEPGAAAEVGLPLSPLDEDPYTAIIKHFYDCLVNDKPFSVTAQDGLAALEIALAAIESAQTGLPVTLRESAAAPADEQAADTAGTRGT